ncbi:MAG: Fic family protein [Eggerthellaceae bacterium]|nr:Fic family protein [Eggerthellaceae bacterium]
MTADNVNDFPYEPAERALDPATRRAYWDVAMGLQDVDGLHPSAYLRQLADEHVAGVRSLDETGAMLRAYYAERDAAGEDPGARRGVPAAGDGGEREADFVSQRIAEVLARQAFALIPATLKQIHAHLFGALDAQAYRPGVYKDVPLLKSELILNGDSVSYADPSLVESSLDFAFSEERGHLYTLSFEDAELDHFARFISRVWQVHPFCQGNTRTVAVFAILYLNDLGFDVDNRPFAEHATYFRNALVRANYRNAKAGVLPDRAPLNRFFDNVVNGATHELRSRDLMMQALFDNPNLLRNMSPSRAIVNRVN